jgi:hypothetical protein
MRRWVWLMVAMLAGCRGARESDAPLPGAAAPVSPAPPPATRPCPENVARTMFRAYTLAVPMRGGLVATQIGANTPLAQFVTGNKEMFGRNAPATRCARAVAFALLAGAGAQAREGAAGADRIAERWGSSVPPSIVADAQRDVRSQGSDAYALSQELAWLAQVLPDVANDDFTSFNTTGTMARQALRQMGPMMNPIMTSNPQLRAQVDGMMKAYGSMLEGSLVRVAVAMQ